MSGIKIGLYRHYKGNLYEVIGIARHSETEEEFVVYRALYGDQKLWIRPRKMFSETVMVDNREVYRFEYLGEMIEGVAMNDGIHKKANYYISTDKSHLNTEFIFDFLHFQSYWARGIPRETFQRSIDNTALCFGLFEGDPLKGKAKQIGFARVISDLATFAYLADVFVDEEYRRAGLAQWLLQVIKDHPQLQGLRRSMLATKDAHRLYEKFGFKPLEDEGIFLEKTFKGYKTTD